MISFIINVLILWLFAGIVSMVLGKMDVVSAKNETAKKIVFWIEFPANYLWKLFNRFFKIG